VREAGFPFLAACKPFEHRAVGVPPQARTGISFLDLAARAAILAWARSRD
jgi:hypothetical protein